MIKQLHTFLVSQSSEITWSFWATRELTLLDINFKAINHKIPFNEKLKKQKLKSVISEA
jgi:hypothetical protein